MSARKPVMGTGLVPGRRRKDYHAGSADWRRGPGWQVAGKPWQRVRLEERQGFLLLELVVAIALLGIFLVSLCTGLATVKAQAECFDEAWHETVIAEGRDSQTAAAWTWGPKIVDAQWRSESLGRGVVLLLRMTPPEDEDGKCEAIVGLWVDGWLLAEMSADVSLTDVSSSEVSSFGVGATGTLCLDSSFWQSHEGRELVVRVRAEEGTWGPPWRTFVPESRDLVSTEAKEASQIGGTEVVIHAPRLGMARSQVAVDGHTVSVSEAGPPLIYSGELTGRWTSQLEGAVQAWQGEVGRSLDVYY